MRTKIIQIGIMEQWNNGIMEPSSASLPQAGEYCELVSGW